MFRDRYQAGFLSLFYSAGPKQADIWEQRWENGYVKRMTDQDVRCSVAAIVSSDIASTFMTCPKDPKEELGVSLPCLVLAVKYLKKYFTFEVQILDDTNTRRRLRAANYQSRTCIKPFMCMFAVRLDPGWSQVHLDLADFTRRAFGTNYVETLRVTVFANCRVKRVYFCDRRYTEEELPAEYRLGLAKGDSDD